MKNPYKILAIIFLFFTSSICHAAPTAKITLKVEQVDGTPIDGAKTGIGFYLSTSGSGTKTSGVTGLTDKNGIFTGEGSTQPLIGYTAVKNGYYRSTYQYDDFDDISGIIGFRHWEPWNPTLTIKLKKKINPIPMYAVNLFPIEIPLLNKEVGFDLIERDWVAPYGKGVHRDFIIKFVRQRFNSVGDWKFKFILTFSNENDGILDTVNDTNMNSRLWLPHNAYYDGYKSELTIIREREKGKSYKSRAFEPKHKQSYMFRVRSVTNPQGKIQSALYGKLYGGFNLSNIPNLGKEYIGFKYYLNPTPNDLNLEFDPKKNLFKNLSRDQRVHKP